MDSEEELKNHVVHSKDKETEAQRSDLPQVTELVSDKPGLNSCPHAVFFTSNRPFLP